MSKQKKKQKDKGKKEQNETNKKGWVNWLQGGFTFLSLIISAFALINSRNALQQTEEHNRLTLRPYITINFIYNTDQGAGLLVNQTGLGPAIIKSFEVEVDGKQKSTWREVAGALNLPEGQYNYSILYPGSSLPSGHSEQLFFFYQGPAIKLLNDNSYRVTIKTCYCSLYNECWITSNKIVNGKIHYEQVEKCPSKEFKFHAAFAGD